MPCLLVGQGHLLDAVVLQLAGSRHWQFINKSIEPRALLSGDSVGTAAVIHKVANGEASVLGNYVCSHNLSSHRVRYSHNCR